MKNDSLSELDLLKGPPWSVTPLRVMFSGPDAAGDWVDARGLCYYLMPHGCPWSILGPAAMLVSVGGHVDVCMWLVVSCGAMLMSGSKVLLQPGLVLISTGPVSH